MSGAASAPSIEARVDRDSSRELTTKEGGFEMRNAIVRACVLGFTFAMASIGCDAADEPTRASGSTSVTQSATVTTSARPLLRGISLSGAEWDHGPAYPTPSEVNTFVRLGMTTIRIPFKWSRIQPTPLGEFDAAEWAKLDAIVRYTSGTGATVILDPHDFAAYKGHVLGTPGAPIAYFEDLWARFARVYRDDGRVIFGLMNEPTDIATETWLSAANRAIAAIRREGAANLVLVPGAGWDKVSGWFSDGYGTPNSVAMLGVVDPQDNYAYEFHHYFDVDNSGLGPCVSIDSGVQSLTPLIDWLRQHGRRGFLGEVGIERSYTCYAALARTLRLVEQSADVMLGWGMWAAGSGWEPTYNLSLQPVDGVHTAQMQAALPFFRPLAHRSIILTGMEYGPLPGQPGVDYTYPTSFELDHFLGRGMSTIVLPLRWQRVQPTRNGPLAAAELSRIDQTIAAIHARGATAVLRIDGRPEAFGGAVGDDLPDSVFANLWSRLATRYRNSPRVAFGLASYAHDVTTARWASAAQAAITAIRNAGGHHLVFVSGNGWSDASGWSSSWYGTPNATGMLNVHDPDNALAFDARLFVDTIGSGSGTTCATPDTVSARIRPFVHWLREQGRRGFIGAFGAPSGSSECLAALARGANEIADASDVLVGYAYSQAGPWSFYHPYSIQPIPGEERPQWASLGPILRGFTTELGITGSWSNGFCAEVVVHNEGVLPANFSSVRVQASGLQLSASWNARFTLGSGVLEMTPLGTGTVAPYDFTKFGFCATHNGPRPPIAILSAQ